MALDKYIAQDLSNRILSGADPPPKLTLAALAARYETSLTPVRAAVEALIEKGVILKRPNGRLEANPKKKGRGGARQAIPAPRTPQDWDRILIQEVVRASLGPKPVYLREEALAHKHGVGRSVIRQTLSRFAGAGLVDHVARRGWRVHPLSEPDMKAYIAMREVLELKALDLARPRLNREDLRQMLEDNPVPQPGEAARLDNRLHEYLIERSGNRCISDFFRQQVALYYSALFDYAAPEASLVAEMAAQHRRILKALIQENWARARQALSKHIRTQGPVLMMALERAAPPGSP
ncbi:MAG: GntR family transcriptional regulator [Candidatus Sumerlaeota bacterium]|nr:GntR family transcriptional regulator [Candidatus Sumerlaeota bacterium]